MNREQCAQVLAKIQLGDNRQVDQLVLDEWFHTIGHLSFQDSIEAVREHRLTRPGVWIEPGHVAAGVKAIGNDRVSRQPLEAPDNAAPKPANWDAMVAAWNDPVEFAREKAIYSQQLVDAGLPPLYERGWASERGV